MCMTFGHLRIISCIILIASCVNARALTAAFSLSPSSLSEQLFEENFDEDTSGWIFPDTEHIEWQVMKTAGTMDFSQYNPADAGSMRIKGAADFADREMADAISPAFEIKGAAKCTCYVGFSHDFDDMGSLEIAAVDKNGSATLLWSSLNSEMHEGWQWRRLELSFIPRSTGSYRLRFRYTSGRLAAAFTDGGCQASFYVDDIEVAVRPEFPGEGASISAGESVTFYNHTDCDASLSWSFPGGTPAVSSEENPVVTYKTPGVYNVVLTARKGNDTDVCTAAGFISVESVTPVVEIVSSSKMRAEGSGHYAVPPCVPVRFSPANPDILSWCNWHIASGRSDNDCVTRDGKAAYIEFYDEGERIIAAQAANDKGNCRAEVDVDVVRRARMANGVPNLSPELISMSKLGSEIAEVFPQPEVPCAVDNVNIMVTDIKASGAATVAVAIAYMEDGAPGEIISETTARLSELNLEDNGSVRPLSIDFPMPVVVTEKPWAVVVKFSGVADCNVASISGEYDNALVRTPEGWRQLDNRSFRVSPACTYSVLRTTEATGSRIDFKPSGSAATISFRSLLSCKYLTEADWVKVDVQSDGYDYTVHLEAEPLTFATQRREADFVVTDGISNLIFRLCQNSSGELVPTVSADALFEINGGTISLRGGWGSYMNVWKADGSLLSRDVRSFGAPGGIYIVEVIDADSQSRFFRLAL